MERWLSQNSYGHIFFQDERQTDLYEIMFLNNVYFLILVGKSNLTLAYVFNEVNEANAIDVKLENVPLIFVIHSLCMNTLVI